MGAFFWKQSCEFLDPFPLTQLLTCWRYSHHRLSTMLVARVALFVASVHRPLSLEQWIHGVSGLIYWKEKCFSRPSLSLWQFLFLQFDPRPPNLLELCPVYLDFGRCYSAFPLYTRVWASSSETSRAADCSSAFCPSRQLPVWASSRLGQNGSLHFFFKRGYIQKAYKTI